MSNRDTLISLTTQGLGLNLSGLLLVIGGQSVIGPLGWTSLSVALLLKLIGDSQLMRAYWIWKAEGLTSR
jgi:hypothetical protein